MRALFFAVFLSTAFFAHADDDEAIKAGEGIFKAKCATCHALNMKKDLTGPALAGLEERWADYPREELYDWIRNSQAQIAAGQPRAVELWGQWQPTVMNNFTELSDEDMENIISFINYKAAGGGKEEAAAAEGGAAAEEVEETDNTLLITVLFVVLLSLAFVLSRIVGNLNRLAKIKAGEKPDQQRSLLEQMTSNSVVRFLTFLIIVTGGWLTIDNAIKLGRQQGYGPDQPIKFSHATHAGMNGIDCQYCHDGARRSKHSVIPATNTCINCHAAINKGSKYGHEELVKVFASAGYDPGSNGYIPGLENMSDAEKTIAIKKSLFDWLKADEIKTLEGSEKYSGRLADLSGLKDDPQAQAKYAELKKEIEKKAEQYADRMLAGAEGMEGQPIEWVRIHNLPDHVYFNHAQHVVAGGIQCQTCHGKIEEMEVVAQHSPLSMGWCINCHRKTEVKFADNPYYESFEYYHEELKKGERSSVTVEEIGGLECQKCHY